MRRRLRTRRLSRAGCCCCWLRSSSAAAAAVRRDGRPPQSAEPACRTQSAWCTPDSHTCEPPSSDSQSAPTAAWRETATGSTPSDGETEGREGREGEGRREGGGSGAVLAREATRVGSQEKVRYVCRNLSMHSHGAVECEVQHYSTQPSSGEWKRDGERSSNG